MCLTAILAIFFSIFPALSPYELFTSKSNAVSANPTPVCDGTICIVTFEYSGDYYSWTAPKSATYTFKVWGAQGGRITSLYPIDGGKGGYSSGTKNLTQGEVSVKSISKAAKTKYKRSGKTQRVDLVIVKKSK